MQKITNFVINNKTRNNGLIFNLYYSNFCFNLFFKNIGTNEMIANISNNAIEVQEKAVSVACILYNVCPVCIATNDGGATPTNVPVAKGTNGTPITGALRFINQFGRNGVTRKNTM